MKRVQKRVSITNEKQLFCAQNYYLLKTGLVTKSKINYLRPFTYCNLLTSLKILTE